jgi:Ca2+-binding RTX toxin-like protein
LTFTCVLIGDGVLSFLGQDNVNDHLTKIYANQDGIVQFDQPGEATIVTGIDADDVKSVSIIARSGNDTVDLTTSFGGIPFLDKIEVFGEAGNDTLKSPPFGEVKLSEGAQRRIFLNGGDNDDRLIGNSDRDDLNGGDGVDEIWGGEGSDNIQGGAGNDAYLQGDDGDDVISGGGGADVYIAGSAGNDTIDGGDGDDTEIRGDAGEDTIDGGEGNDTIYGGPDRDVIRGSGGNDSIWGGTGDDDLYGDAGTDSISGEEGEDEITGGSEADSLNGGAGNDRIWGNDGNDALNGQDGIDFLWGGTGGDSFDGGADSDFTWSNSGPDDKDQPYDGVLPLFGVPGTLDMKGSGGAACDIEDDHVECAGAITAVNDLETVPSDSQFYSWPGFVSLNDSGADPLTAVLVTTTQHGTLNLYSEGGFYYQPDL